MTKIYQNVLPQKQLCSIQDLFLTNKIPWHFTDRVVSTEKHFMFCHTFMEDGKMVNARFFEPIRILLLAIEQKIKYIGVSRIRAVLYTNQGREIVHPSHFDIPTDSNVSDKFKIAVFYVNTCNGKTVIGNKEIESKENQLVIFDNVAHHGTVQTDTDTRIVINISLRIE